MLPFIPGATNAGAKTATGNTGCELKANRICLLLAVSFATTLALAQNAGKGGDQVELTYWTMLDHSSKDARAQAERAILNKFMQENPNIKVRVDTTPWNQLPQKTILAVQSGGGPDVSRVSFGQTLEYINLQVLKPLN